MCIGGTGCGPGVMSDPNLPFPQLNQNSLKKPEVYLAETLALHALEALKDIAAFFINAYPFADLRSCKFNDGSGFQGV